MSELSTFAEKVKALAADKDPGRAVVDVIAACNQAMKDAAAAEEAEAEEPEGDENPDPTGEPSGEVGPTTPVA